MQTTTSYFNGPGEVRALLQAFDYAGAGVAPPQAWSPALRATMQLMLDSAIPTRVAIGPELHLFYNDAYIDFLGERHPAALGRPYFTVWPEIRPKVEPLLLRVLGGESIFLDELPLVLVRGGRSEPTWFSYTFTPVRDDGGAVVAIYGACIELTRQKMLEAQLSDHNRRLTDMFDSLEQASRRARFQVDLSDEIRYAGDAYAVQARASAALGHFLGADRVCFGDYGDGDDILIHSSFVAGGVRELIGTHPIAALDWVNPAHFRPDGRAVPTGAPDGGEGVWTIAVPQYRSDAHLQAALFVQRRSAPWSDDELLLVDDAGARIWTAVEKADAEAALRQADRRKDEFLAMLAHELRNPLAPISAAAALLTSVPLSAAQLHKTGEVIARQVRHMGALVDDLLDVSRVTKGLVKLDMEDLDARAVVAAAVEQARPLLQERRHTVSVRVAPDPVFVRGDHKRLIQVLSNLLNNAAKYTPEGGEVSVQLGATEDAVQVAVTDSGIGVAPGMEERIFELFAQAERTSDRAQGGLGLGLSLVRSIALLHGGAVRCTSAGLGQGATFTLTLPRLCLPSGTPGADAGADAPAAPPARKLAVLVVDDNADAATMLGMYVVSLGHAAHVEHSAAGALAAARGRRIDVGLFDIGLPGMDGYELARQMRAQPETARMLLVAVTGYGDKADVAAAHAAGFDHHLVKPLDPARLGELLAAHASQQSSPSSWS